MLLHRGRAHGYSGPLSISMTDINAYCELLGIDNYEDRIDVVRCVTLLDDAYLSDFYDKQKTEQNKAKAKAAAAAKPRSSG